MLAINFFLLIERLIAVFDCSSSFVNFLTALILFTDITCLWRVNKCISNVESEFKCRKNRKIWNLNNNYEFRGWLWILLWKFLSFFKSYMNIDIRKIIHNSLSFRKKFQQEEELSGDESVKSLEWQNRHKLQTRAHILKNSGLYHVTSSWLNFTKTSRTPFAAWYLNLNFRKKLCPKSILY